MGGSDDELRAALRARGQRVTVQRLLILRALRDMGRHASAEEVMAAVGERLPNVSLPTVYAALDLLAELGLARRIAPGSGPALYDPRLDGHSHAVCRRCGTVIDVPAPAGAGPALAAAGELGFRPQAAELVVSGLCRGCHQ